MKDRLYYVPADDADSDKVGAYLLDAAGTALTSTLVGADQALDVNVVQSVLPNGAATEATLADILADTANIDTNIAAILADTANIDTNVAAILADTADIEIATEAIAADIAALEKAEDAAHSSGDSGIMSLAVRRDADTSLVDTDGDYAPLQVDANGRLKVAAEVSVEPSDAEYAEDSAHSSGDTGLFMLAVRHDADTSLADTDGDYAPLQVDANGALKISGAVEVADSTPDTAILASAAAVSDVAASLVTALSNRRRILIENLGNKSIYVGDSGVADTDGFRVSPGSVLDLDLGPSVAVYAVCSSGQSANVRVLEVA